MIALHEIHDGDRVELRDELGNRATGLVRITHAGARTKLTVLIFGVAVPFAEHLASGWRAVGHNQITAHQPDLGLEVTR